MNLNGYKAVTAAKVQYDTTGAMSSRVTDFRWAKQSLTLTDSSNNQETVALTNSFDARICYSFASATYYVLQPCTGPHHLATNRQLPQDNAQGGTTEELRHFQPPPSDLGTNRTRIA